MKIKHLFLNETVMKIGIDLFNSETVLLFVYFINIYLGEQIRITELKKYIFNDPKIYCYLY